MSSPTVASKRDSQNAARVNIQTVAKLEEEFLQERTALERVADAIANFTGSIWFVILHVLGFISWFTVNSGAIPGVRPYDPYPFIFLGMVVSCEAVLLSTFVLMKQNRMSRRADQRDHLNLQISLLAEKEITKLLQMQQSVCRHLGLEHEVEDEEVQELSQYTAVEGLAHELKESLPEE